MSRLLSLVLLLAVVGCVEDNLQPLPTTGRSLTVFSATWCQPCQRDKPVVNSLKGHGISVEEYDYDRDRRICESYGVTSVPTYLVWDSTNPVPIYRGSSIADAIVALEGQETPPDVPRKRHDWPNINEPIHDPFPDGRSKWPRL